MFAMSEKISKSTIKRVIEGLVAVMFVALICVMFAQVVLKELPLTEKIVIEWYSEYSGSVPFNATIEGVESAGDWGEYLAGVYEAENPGVDIVSQVAVYTGGSSEQLSVRLAAGRVPTVYEGFSGRLFTYAPLFLELPKPTAPFLPEALDALAYADKIIAYPITYAGSLPVLNVTLVKNAGCKVPDVQWTTVEATELAKCLSDSGLGHLMAFWTQKQSGHNYQWGWFSGGASLFENGNYLECTFNTDYAIDYLEWEKSLLPYLPGNPSQYDVLSWLDPFYIGKIAIGARGFVPQVEAAFLDGTIKERQVFVPVNWPHLPSVDGNPLHREAERAVAVFASSVEGNDKLKEEAIKFAEWITGPGPNFAHDYRGSHGSREDTQSVPMSPEALKVQEEFGAWGPGFASGGFNQGRTVWSEETYKFWAGEQTARETLDNFCGRYNEIQAEIW